jgi:predicted DNA-binding protein (MmcQ/YjbR family)
LTRTSLFLKAKVKPQAPEVIAIIYIWNSGILNSIFSILILNILKMNIEAIQEFCKSLPGVTEDIKWEDHLCFNIGGKMFVVTSLNSQPLTFSFKATDEDFAGLSATPGFIPAPYMARHKWILCEDAATVPQQKFEYLARQSYDLVKARLPKKLQKELGIINN